MARGGRDRRGAARQSPFALGSAVVLRMKNMDYLQAGLSAKVKRPRAA